MTAAQNPKYRAQRPKGPSATSKPVRHAQHDVEADGLGSDLRAENHDGHAEEAREEIGGAQIDPNAPEPLAPVTPGFADPVAVAQDGQASANASEDAQHRDQGTVRRAGERDAPHDFAQVGTQRPGADQEGYEHHPDEDFHNDKEKPESAYPDHYARGQGMDDAPLRHREPGENRVTGQPCRRQQSAADQEGPDDQIEEKEILYGSSEALHPAFQKRGSRSKLPAPDPFVQGELQYGAPDDRPQQHGAELRAGVGSRDHVARAHPGGGDGDARPHHGDYLEKVLFQSASRIICRNACRHALRFISRRASTRPGSVFRTESR